MIEMDIMLPVGENYTIASGCGWFRFVRPFWDNGVKWFFVDDNIGVPGSEVVLLMCTGSSYFITDGEFYAPVEIKSIPANWEHGVNIRIRRKHVGIGVPSVPWIRDFVQRHSDGVGMI